MNEEQLCTEIIKLCGGKENIQSCMNCMTRVRVTVNEPSLVEVDELKATKGILGVVITGPSYQIVMGPGKARKLSQIINEKIDNRNKSIEGEGPEVSEDNFGKVGSWKENKDALKSKQKTNGFKEGTKLLSNIFVPLIPAIITSGLFFGLGALVSTLLTNKVLPDVATWKIIQNLFSLMGSAFLGYFVIFTGYNAALQFGATPCLGGMLGAVSIGGQVVNISKILGLYNETTPLNSILTTGKGGLIGVIFGVWILSKIEKALHKKMPGMLDLVVTPVLTMLLCTILYVFVVMPVTGVLSDLLVKFLSLFINSKYFIVNVISGYLLSSLFLPLVLFGMHHGLIPIYAIQLERFGGVSLFPVLAMAGAGQVGSCIAIYLKARKLGKTNLCEIIAGALPAGFLGVGEPLIYGVTLPLFKPFITAGLGAGFGGAYIMASHVMSNAWGTSGLLAIPIMKPECIINYIIGLVVSYIAGFIITSFVIKDKDIENV